MNSRRTFLKNVSLAGAGLGLGAWSSPPGARRIGLIGLDTSHSEVFTRLIHESSPYKVVAAYAQGSRDIPSALQLKPGVTAAVQKMGVELTGSIAELLDKVDCVLLETNDGRPHLEQVLPVLKAGKRVFVDKPLAASLADAEAIFQAAENTKTPLFTSSALRFDVSVQKVVQGSIGPVTGADVYAPATLEPHHLDLAWYAIHGVEMLSTVMGTGCKRLSRVYQDGTDLVTAVWEDGRIGTIRGIRKGASNIAGTAFGEKGIAPLGPFASYQPLVDRIIRFFDTGEPPVTPQQTLEIFRFLDAADKSRRKGGKTIAL